MERRKIKAKFGTERAYEDLRGEATGKKGMMEAFRQGAENGEDAILEKFEDRTAGEISIILNKRAGEARILDNGKGFGKDEIQGFFAWYDSPKRGKGGRTIGQHGSGRVFLLRYCKKIRVYSVSEAYPGGIMLELTEDQLKELFSKKEIDGDYYVNIELPSWWHLPKGVTGSAIELIDVDWKRVPDPKEVIDTFASYLRPSIARKIRVNGTPLKPLQIIGEPVQRTFDVEGLGEVEVELYVPAKHERWHAVRIGAHNPVCSLREFADNLDSKLETMIPDMLYHSIAGDIFIPSLNPHVAPDRKSFKDSLLGGTHNVIVRFLNEELEPILTDAYARKEREDRRRRDAEMCKAVCGAINEAFNFNPKDLKKIREKDEEPEALPAASKTTAGGLAEDTTPVVIKRRAEIMVGDWDDFRVPQIDDVNEKTIEWDDSHSGGTLNVFKGPDVRYTAGEVEGKGFLLVAKDTKTGRTVMEVAITIVTSKDFYICPRSRDVEQGSSIRLRVRNYHDGRTSGKIGWRVQRRKGVRLNDTEGLHAKLEIAEDALLGTVEVTAYDLENPSIETTVKYNIVLGDKGNYLKLRDCTGKDHHFEFKRATTQQSQMVVLSMHSRLAGTTTSDRSNTVGRVIADFEHEDFQHLQELDSQAAEGKESWLQLLTPSIILAFLDEQVRIGILEPGDYSNEFHKLRHEVLKARACKKKK